MKFVILFLLFGSLSCAYGGSILREDATYWYSSVVESGSIGPVAISFVCDEGELIELQNLSEQRFDLQGWTIKQEINGQTVVSYTFEYCSIPARAVRKIVANNMADQAYPTDFVATDVDMWASGNDIRTMLYDRNATLVAKYFLGTAYSNNKKK